MVQRYLLRAFMALTMVLSILVTNAPSSSADSASKLHMAAAGGIAGQFIVSFNDQTITASQTNALAKVLVKNHHGKFVRVFSQAIKGFVTTMSATDALALSNEPAVASVDEDSVVKASAVTQFASSSDWGRDRINWPSLPLDNQATVFSASNVHAYIMDSGIDYANPEFGGRATLGFDVFAKNGSDCNGHGTGVASILGGKTAGVSYDVKLVSVRVLDCNGNGSVAGVISGFDWVAAHAVKPAVINLSVDTPYTTFDAMHALHVSLQNVVAHGISVFTAAGNTSASGNAEQYPAAFSEAISVGSTAPTDSVSAFSTQNSHVSVYAPGENIPMSGLANSWTTGSGTSMASPLVAGVGAAYLSWHPTATPAAVRGAIVSSAVPDVEGVTTGTNLFLQVSSAIRHTNGDFNGDGKTDFAVFDVNRDAGEPNSVWGSNSDEYISAGAPGDIPVSGQYVSRGTTSAATYDPTTSDWQIYDNDSQVLEDIQWGVTGDIPVPGDYNGDGLTDIAVYRPSTRIWYIRGIATIQWGVSGDIPQPGDYNGDGKTDFAVFRPGNRVWYIRGISTTQWGVAGDIPMPGDYNGKGISQIAVFRPSTRVWYVYGGPTIQWGVNGDIPQPGDYNGDGKTDIAVFRPSNHTWYVRGIITEGWGYDGEVPSSHPNPGDTY